MLDENKPLLWVMNAPHRGVGTVTEVFATSVAFVLLLTILVTVANNLVALTVGTSQPLAEAPFP